MAFGGTCNSRVQQLAHYDLVVGKNGAKINESAPGQDHANLIIAIGPRTATLPARNATIERFASLLQGAVLDRPVVDKTGLSWQKMRVNQGQELVIAGWILISSVVASSTLVLNSTKP